MCVIHAADFLCVSVEQWTSDSDNDNQTHLYSNSSPLSGHTHIYFGVSSSKLAIISFAKNKKKIYDQKFKIIKNQLSQSHEEKPKQTTQSWKKADIFWIDKNDIVQF